jgi:hypothetical protein
MAFAAQAKPFKQVDRRRILTIDDRDRSMQA